MATYGFCTLVDDKLVFTETQRLIDMNSDEQAIFYNCVACARKEGLDIHDGYLKGGTTEHKEKPIILKSLKRL